MKLFIKFSYKKLKSVFCKLKFEYSLFKYSRHFKCGFGENFNFTGSLKNISIGEGTMINGNANFRFKNGRISIGNSCLIARNVTIITQSYELDNKKEISSDNMYAEDVFIGDGVWIGCNVVILPGIKIGEHAVVGAGSIVTKNIGDYEIWAGVPAKKIRKRKVTDEQ